MLGAPGPSGAPSAPPQRSKANSKAKAAIPVQKNFLKGHQYLLIFFVVALLSAAAMTVLGLRYFIPHAAENLPGSRSKRQVQIHVQVHQPASSVEPAGQKDSMAPKHFHHNLGKVEEMTAFSAVDESLRQSITPYSVLRDPVDGKVRLFFDGEGWLWSQLSTLTFSMVPIPPKEAEEEEGNTKRVHCFLEGLGDAPRREEGWAMTCVDPGAHYRWLFIFPPVIDGDMAMPQQAVYVLTIETLDMKLDGEIGWCSAPLYSGRLGLANWIGDAVSVGVDRIHAYVAIAQPPSFSRFHGITEMQPQWAPVSPVTHPAITYYSYHPPPQRYYFGQGTVLNECIYRHRHMHSYIVVADTDEFLAVRHAEVTLNMLLHHVFLAPVAGILVDVVLYPLNCQPLHSNGSVVTQIDANISLLNSCHLFDGQTKRMYNPKPIIMPNRTEYIMIHKVKAAKPGFETVGPSVSGQIHFKHLRAGEPCPDSYRNVLVNDEDEKAFHKAMVSNADLVQSL